MTRHTITSASQLIGSKKTRMLFMTALLTAFTWMPLSCNYLKADSDWLNLTTDQEKERYTIRFNDVAASELINFVSRISGKNFIYDPKQLDFKITIVSDDPVTAEEVLASLIQIMKANGISPGVEGNTILLYSGSEKGGVSSLPRLASAEDAEGLVTRIFNIKYADLDSIQKVLTTLATPMTNIASMPSTRHIIISDTAVNLHRIEELIRSLDQVDVSQDVEVYKVKYASITALKAFAEQVLLPFSNDPVSLIPNNNSNALFIVGSRQMIDRTVNILNVLDVPNELEIIAKARDARIQLSEKSTDPAKLLDPQINPEFYVYKLQYHQGDKILESLKQISTTMMAASTEQALDTQLLNSMNSLQWLDSTNSLIFTGSDSTLIKMKNLIHSLDTPVKQVFIEALIIDTSIQNAASFSVELGNSFQWDPARIGVSVGNYRSNGTIASSVSANAATSTFSPPTPAPTDFSVGVIGSAISHKGKLFSTIGSMITAVEGDSDSRVILNPKIITEDNVTCSFFVGETSRLKTGAVQNSGNNNVTSSNFEVINIGTTLKITPTISSDELITLEVSQETSQGLDTSTATDTSALVPISKTSRTQTRLHVPNKHFVILSGMIDSKTELRHTNVPILGSIPLLGWLFKSNSSSDNRRNLLFFIRPQVVRTNEEARLITQRHIDLVDQKKYLDSELENHVNLIHPKQSSPSQVNEVSITSPLENKKK